jgi:hypothetical protein
MMDRVGDRFHDQIQHLGSAVTDRIAIADVVIGRDEEGRDSHCAPSWISIQSRSLDFRAQITLPILKVGIRTLASPA